MSDAAKVRWARERKDRLSLSQEDKETLAWGKQHRASIEYWHGIGKGICKGILSLAGFAAITIGLAGYLNYYMLLEIPNAPIAQFFSEIALLLIVWKLDYCAARISLSKSDAAEAVAAAVAAVAAASLF